MSSESLPITPAAFAEAITELPLPSIYAKVSELRNSIAHLQRSNLELQVFISESCETEADKRELEVYISENEGVTGSMNDRIQLCRAEVERRGQRWIELDANTNDEAEGEGEGEQGSEQERPAESGATPTPATAAVNGTGTSTPASQEPSRAREDDEGEDGVYL